MFARVEDAKNGTCTRASAHVMPCAPPHARFLHGRYFVLSSIEQNLLTAIRISSFELSKRIDHLLTPTSSEVPKIRQTRRRNRITGPVCSSLLVVGKSSLARPSLSGTSTIYESTCKFVNVVRGLERVRRALADPTCACVHTVAQARCMVPSLELVLDYSVCRPITRTVF